MCSGHQSSSGTVKPIKSLNHLQRNPALHDIKFRLLCQCSGSWLVRFAQRRRIRARWDCADSVSQRRYLGMYLSPRSVPCHFVGMVRRKWASKFCLALEKFKIYLIHFKMRKAFILEFRNYQFQEFWKYYMKFQGFIQLYL